MFFEEFQKNAVCRSGFWHKVNRPHELGQGNVEMLLCCSQQDILTEHESHHVIGFGIVHRYPAVHTPAVFHVCRFLDGKACGYGKGNGSGSHHIAGGNLAQLQDVGNDRLLVGLDYAGFAAQGGDGSQLFGGKLVRGLTAGNKLGYQLRQENERFQRNDEEPQGKNNVWSQLAGEVDSHGFRQDFCKQQDGQGEEQREPDESLFAKRLTAAAPATEAPMVWARVLRVRMAVMG